MSDKVRDFVLIVVGVLTSFTVYKTIYGGKAQGVNLGLCKTTRITHAMDDAQKAMREGIMSFITPL